MPGDGFAFAVGVGGQIQRVGVAQRFFDGLHMLGVAIDRLIRHRKAALGVDGAFFGYQVAHVAVGGQYVKLLAQVFVDGARLGGRFDDKQVMRHKKACPVRPWTDGVLRVVEKVDRAVAVARCRLGTP